MNWEDNLAKESRFPLPSLKARSFRSRLIFMNTITDYRPAIIAKVQESMDRANRILGRNFAMPICQFVLNGTTAGLANSSKWRLTFNLDLAARHWEEFSACTVPHECAHIVADAFFAKRCMHGPDWKWIMSHVFGLEPRRCHQYNVTGLRAKRTRRHFYKCNCVNPVKVGTKHHNRIMGGNTGIYCRTCSCYLTPAHYVNSIVLE